MTKPEFRTAVRMTGEYAQCVNPGLKFLSFTAMAKTIIRHRLKIRVGAPHRQRRLFKSQLMRLCLASGTRLLEKVAAYRSLPNGDWRPLGGFETWIPPGPAYDHERIGVIVSEGTVSAVCSSRFTRWKDARWTGADKQFDEAMMMEGVNGLYSLTLVGFDEEARGAPLEARLHRVGEFIEQVLRPHVYGALPAPAEEDAGGDDDNVINAAPMDDQLLAGNPITSTRMSKSSWGAFGGLSTHALLAEWQCSDSRWRCLCDRGVHFCGGLLTAVRANRNSASLKRCARMRIQTSYTGHTQYLRPRRMS